MSKKNLTAIKIMFFFSQYQKKIKKINEQDDSYCITFHFILKIREKLSRKRHPGPGIYYFCN
jgi:hypothetical protein